MLKEMEHLMKLLSLDKDQCGIIACFPLRQNSPLQLGVNFANSLLFYVIFYSLSNNINAIVAHRLNT